MDDTDLVQWFYDSSDTDEFEQSIEMRLRRADAWADGAVFDPDTAREALRFRHDSRDGRLGYWTPELVREFLTEIVPERFTGGIEHYAHVPEALRTWLRFLEHAGALDPHGSDLSGLERAVDECAEDFPAAFAEPARWGPARIVAEAALASGIDPATPGGAERLNAFMADGHDSEATAAAVARQHERRLRNQRTPPLPAAEVPAPGRAAALASETEAVRAATAFLDWLGEGRAITQKGNLRKADAVALVELLGTGDDTESFASAADLPVLHWHTELVLGAGLARRVKQRLVPVAKHARLTRDPYALLLAAWEAEALWRPQRPGLFAARRDDDGSVLRLLVEALLGSACDIDLPVAEIRRRIAAAVYGDTDDPDDLRGMVVALTLYRDIDHVLTALHRFGAIESDREWEIDDEVGLADPAAEVSVRLTDLGRALLWTKRREAGLAAPALGELTGCPASVMLMSVVEHYGQDTGVEEIRRWLAAHGDDPAPLLEAIAANPFRTSQSAMLGAAADAVGPELLDRAGQDRRLAPIALMLGNLRGRLDLNVLMEGTETERAQAVLGIAEQILEMLEHLGPEGYAASVGDLPPESLEGMAALIAESGHPDRWLTGLFAEEAAPLLAGPGDRRRAGLEAARDRARHAKRRKKRPKKRRR
ncbi:hypothetical protein [Glycomyces arizonensis]|uniref:hypothetical protein n=1 Tax=Glycomyces arizonensis TaxID=256035 RepID=UPI00041057B8|nr:hypothetical protein [Glycomyces arizonensis]